MEFGWLILTILSAQRFYRVRVAMFYVVSHAFRFDFKAEKDLFACFMVGISAKG